MDQNKSIGTMPRILCVTPFYKPAYRYGGPTRSIPALCEGLASLGCDVAVYTTVANGNTDLDVVVDKPINLDGVMVYFHRRKFGDYFYSSSLAKRCFETINTFDFVYLNSSWVFPLIPACLSSKKFRTKYIITPRTSFMRNSWTGKYIKKFVYHRLVERSLINSAEAIHYTSEIEKRESAWLDLIPRSFVVPNPTDTSEFSQLPERGTFRNRINISDHTFIILFLGRLEHRKGIDIAIEAFASVSTDFPDAVLVIAGPDKRGYKSSLVSLVHSLQLADKVLFTDYLDEVDRIRALVDSDLFVLTSRSENFGMSVIEAMAVGLPVLISDKVGLKESVIDSKSGIVLPVDIEQIAKQLRELMNERSGLEEMRGNGRTFVIKSYSPTVIADQMLCNFTSPI